MSYFAARCIFFSLKRSEWPVCSYRSTLQLYAFSDKICRMHRTKTAPRYNIWCPLLNGDIIYVKRSRSLVITDIITQVCIVYFFLFMCHQVRTRHGGIESCIMIVCCSYSFCLIENYTPSFVNCWRNSTRLFIFLFILFNIHIVAKNIHIKIYHKSITIFRVYTIKVTQYAVCTNRGNVIFACWSHENNNRNLQGID